jgi:hypothetical protein
MSRDVWEEVRIDKNFSHGLRIVSTRHWNLTINLRFLRTFHRQHIFEIIVKILRVYCVWYTGSAVYQ